MPRQVIVKNTNLEYFVTDIDLDLIKFNDNSIWIPIESYSILSGIPEQKLIKRLKEISIGEPKFISDMNFGTMVNIRTWKDTKIILISGDTFGQWIRRDIIPIRFLRFSPSHLLECLISGTYENLRFDINKLAEILNKHRKVA